MNLLDRVKNILIQPKQEWPRIAEEAATPQSIYLGYVMILAAIGPIVMVIRSGGLLILMAIVSYLVTLAITFLLALIVDALATTFGGEKNFVQSLKLVAYSYTAAWVAGIFLVVPFIGGIVVLLASVYSLYTFFLGVSVMKKCSQDKAVAYTIVVIICAILLRILLAGALVSMMMGGSLAGAGMMGPWR